MSREIVEIQPPFTKEHLELSYNGSRILKCGDWYIKVSKNRGRIPWIVQMGKGIKEDKEFNLGLLIDQEKETGYTNDYSEGASKYVNDTMNKNREARIAKKIFCEFTKK